MRNRAMLRLVVLTLVIASCGGGEPADAPTDATTTTGSPSTTAPAAMTETAPFHLVPADSVMVTGTAICEFTDEGVDPEGGGAGDFVRCELEMSDPRVSGIETHDRLRYYVEEPTGLLWIAEEAVITNDEGTWRGSAQAADDGTPIGEARYVGEGAYEGLVFHYYFADVNMAAGAQVRGWISGGS